MVACSFFKILQKYKFLLFIILAIFSFLLVNFIINKYTKFLSLDLTNGQFYTISPGTKEILAKLDEDINIKIFYSEGDLASSPSYSNYARRIETLIAEYSNLSKKITYEIIKVKSFSDEEELAHKYGLKSISGSIGNPLYFGLVAETKSGKLDVIPFFNPGSDKLLEYSISRVILSLTRDKKPLIYVMSSVPRIVSGIMDFVSNLYADYRVEFVNVNAPSNEFSDIEIPKDTDLLLMIAPVSDLSTLSRKNLEKYILSGKNTLIFADSFVELFRDNLLVNQSNVVDIDKILPAKIKVNIDIEGENIIFDEELAITSQGLTLKNNSSYTDKMGSKDNPNQKSFRNYYNWLDINKNFINQEHDVTAGLNMVRMLSPSYINIDSLPKKLKFTPLLTTSKKTLLVNLQDYTIFNNMHYGNLGVDFTDKQYALAGIISNDIVTKAFPNKFKLALVSDIDIIFNNIWGANSNSGLSARGTDNYRFLMNLIHYLSGNSSLVKIKNQFSEYNRFTVIEDLKTEADAQYYIKSEKLDKEILDASEELYAIFSKSDADLSPKEKKFVTKLEKKIYQLKKELRMLEGSLQSDIVVLGMYIKFFNILFIPILLILFSIFLYRRRNSY